ncbi:MAG: LamG-like jellyroll fold domain-containing protein [Nostoc sp.]|uniref:LamG-like jellyroll fold domain-containing protein n=1 Tax=Nostoc sp. TaxID=1180 RepID=UPI002FF4C972
MPLFQQTTGFLIPADTRNQASNDDYILMVDGNGELYKIKKIDFLLNPYINLPLTETTGTAAAVDISGNGRNATYLNVVNDLSGSILDGTSRISLNSSINALSTLTIGLEFKSASNLNQGLWEFRASQDLTSGTYTPSLMMNPSGKLAVYGYPSGSSYASFEDTAAYNDNDWHKSIVIMSSSNIKIFVDKAKILDISANPITAFSGFFSIGSTRANGNWIGQLKNYRVWEMVLSEAQAISLT